MDHIIILNVAVRIYWQLRPTGIGIYHGFMGDVFRRIESINRRYCMQRRNENERKSPRRDGYCSEYDFNYVLYEPLNNVASPAAFSRKISEEYLIYFRASAASSALR